MVDAAAGTPGTSRIVVGVDGSDHARAAVRWGAAEAALREVPLHLVHATDTDRETLFTSAETARRVREAGHDLLERTRELAAGRHPGLTVTTELTHDEPADALRALARPGTTLVVGHRGLGGFGSLMLGSVGLSVATRSPAAVVVVRGDTDAPPRNVVAAGVRGEDDSPWLARAAEEAALRGARLRLVCVWNVLTQVGDMVSMMDGLDETALRHSEQADALAEGVRRAFPGLDVEVRSEAARSTAGLLVDATAEADLMVLGDRRTRRALGSSLGRVTHTVLHHAACPVLVAPRPE